MSVEVSSRLRTGRVSLSRLKRKAESVLRALGQEKAELSLLLMNNPAMQRLNARYRRKNAPTDVLSFSSVGTLPGGEKILGDVVISVEQAKRQARERKKTLEEELEALLIHGILHLLGYDHERSPEEARAMRRVERRVRRALCQEKKGKL